MERGAHPGDRAANGGSGEGRRWKLSERNKTLRTGWGSWWTRVAAAAILFEGLTGLVITFAPFHATVEWSVLVHTGVGLLTLAPVTWYVIVHWLDYRHYNFSDTVLLGYLGSAALLLCSASGLVVTWQGLFGLRMSPAWRNVHLYSTFVVLGASAVHIGLVYFRDRRRVVGAAVRPLALQTIVAVAAGSAVIAVLAFTYRGPEYRNRLPDDYSYLYGEDRPFAPSLATTSSGGAYDADSLAGSESCGTASCHSEILAEWKPSAHRYAAMDPLFQKVQSVMAEQNGPESTRYCSGCHDPISLFSGSKNLFQESLTGQQGYEEGVSCLSCHSIHETDLQGNADYVIDQPRAYLWQWRREGLAKWASDFLIRTYPDQHLLLSKRVYKAPEYCAACHKQFVDEEVNRVGWVQLQNQYDNWKASHWFVEGKPAETVECRECHMPLVDSRDPARGDDTDYNRSPDDQRHRSHRFLGANTLVPALLDLEGWEKHVELTEQWLKGEFEVPEIREKWREGPVIKMALEVPEIAYRGEEMPIRVVLTANKVGHDFPTGPLDIIQGWVELRVTDETGREIYSSGTVDEDRFIEPGSFMFKAEPVDRYGNLIDRHNLWEMVGVRYRRALFPGYSDTAEFLVPCPTAAVPGRLRLGGGLDEDVRDFDLPAGDQVGIYEVVARLMYRKVDQFLINFLMGEGSGLSAPIVEMNRVRSLVEVRSKQESVTSSKPNLGREHEAARSVSPARSTIAPASQ